MPSPKALVIFLMVSALTTYSTDSKAGLFTTSLTKESFKNAAVAGATWGSVYASLSVIQIAEKVPTSWLATGVGASCGVFVQAANQLWGPNNDLPDPLKRRAATILAFYRAFSTIGLAKACSVGVGALEKAVKSKYDTLEELPANKLRKVRKLLNHVAADEEKAKGVSDEYVKLAKLLESQIWTYEQCEKAFPQQIRSKCGEMYSNIDDTKRKMASAEAAEEAYFAQMLRDIRQINATVYPS